MQRKFRMYRIMALVAILTLGCWSGNAMAQSYKIAPSDVLEISIFGENALTKGQLVVRPDGKVSFPLLGDLQVAGLTTSEVRKEVESKARKYVPGAIATVVVTRLGSLQYYVVGKVAKPGMFNVSNPLTVLQALAMAGGLTPFAKQNQISIVRKDGTKEVRLRFSYAQVKNGEHLEQNIVLKRGDVVIVP